MANPFKFRSIWSKVFGLTAILVTIMLVAASASFIISYYKVNDVRLRVSHLAHVVLPLTRTAANIDSFSLQEEIHLERALRLWSPESASDSVFEEELKRFQEFENGVQIELESAASIIEATLADPRWLSSRDAIEFGRIALLLENIQKEHTEFYDDARAIIEELRTRDAVASADEILALDAEADHLDEELFKLLASLEQLNITQAEEIEAALAQYEQLSKLKAALPEILGFRKGLPDIQVRVGLATGEVLSGNIGSDNAKSYTVMGDTVNIASRLESLNKQYRTRILINELTRLRIGDRFEVREVDSVTVAGKDESTTIY